MRNSEWCSKDEVKHVGRSDELLVKMV